MVKTGEAMTVAEARKRFAGNWLALEVLSRGQYQEPQRVRLLAKARTRNEVCDEVSGVADVYIFFAGPIVPKGWAALY